MNAVDITPLSKLNRDGAWVTELVHSHTHHRLIWITRGQGNVMNAARRQAYGPNSAIFVPAGVTHSFDLKPGHFGWALDVAAHDTLDMPRFPMIMRLRDVAEQRRCGQLIETLQAEQQKIDVNDPDPLTERALRYQAGLLGVWLERTARKYDEADRKMTPAERLVDKFLQVMEARLGLGENIAALAAILDVTPTHLTRCCRKMLGRSALEILNERIHYQARVVLKSNNEPVKVVALNLGFKSAAYFTRAFQNMAGVTPSEFRAG